MGRSRGGIITGSRATRIAAVAKNRQHGFIVILEDIHDPHNAAAILRTCDAFGVQDVYFIFDKEKPYNPKKVGRTSSSSANKWLDFKIFTSIKPCLSSLKRMGYTTIATALATRAKNPYTTKLVHKKIALLLGNEHRGLSSSAIESADIVATIPMRGMVQSLNVSVTAALFIAEISRQRIVSKKSYSLSHKKLLALTKSFSAR